MTYQHIPTWMFVVASPRYPLIVGKEPDFTCELFRYVKVRCHEVAFRFFDVFSTLKKCLAALNFIYMKWQFFDVCYIVLQPPPKPPPPRKLFKNSKQNLITKSLFSSQIKLTICIHLLLRLGYLEFPNHPLAQLQLILDIFDIPKKQKHLLLGKEFQGLLKPFNALVQIGFHLGPGEA